MSSLAETVSKLTNAVFVYFIFVIDLPVVLMINFRKQVKIHSLVKKECLIWFWDYPNGELLKYYKKIRIEHTLFGPQFLGLLSEILFSKWNIRLLNKGILLELKNIQRVAIWNSRYIERWLPCFLISWTYKYLPQIKWFSFIKWTLCITKQNP
jgi:hypothetical protein